MASAAQGKRGWGMSNVVSGSRLTAMAQGPDGKFAVGGGQCKLDGIMRRLMKRLEGAADRSAQ